MINSNTEIVSKEKKEFVIIEIIIVEIISYDITATAKFKCVQEIAHEWGVWHLF